MQVSVVIPLYQKAPYIERCLDSVARQTFTDYEVIVVDDGSTDGGGELARKRKDSRLRVIRQENAGAGAARNSGVAVARSEWTAMLDADDEWRPTFLEATLREAQRQPDLVAVFTNTLDSRRQRPILQMQGFGPVSDYFEFVIANCGVGMTPSTTLARRWALQACGGFREGVRPGEDLDAFVRLAWEGPVAYVPEPLAIYHAGLPGSSMRQARSAAPIFPPTVLSYRERRSVGRIPPRFERSSRQLADHLLLDYVAALLNRGDRQTARHSLLNDFERSSSWTARYWTLRLRLALSPTLHFQLRAAFGRGDG